MFETPESPKKLVPYAWIAGALGLLSVCLVVIMASNSPTTPQNAETLTVAQSHAAKHVQFAGAVQTAEAPLVLPKPAQAFLPAGCRVEAMSCGDLNADGREDLVFIGVGTDPKKLIKRDDGYVLDGNVRTLVVLLAEKGGYRKVAEAANFVPPAYTPEFDNWLDRFHELKIEKGVLSVSFHWLAFAGTSSTSMETFKFRLEQGRVRLIGSEEDSFSRNLGDKTLTSTNYLTGKRKITTGLNEFDEKESHPEVRWETLGSKKPLYLEDLPPCGQKE